MQWHMALLHGLEGTALICTAALSCTRQNFSRGRTVMYIWSHLVVSTWRRGIAQACIDSRAQDCDHGDVFCYVRWTFTLWQKWNVYIASTAQHFSGHAFGYGTCRSVPQGHMRVWVSFWPLGIALLECMFLCFRPASLGWRHTLIPSDKRLRFSLWAPPWDVQHALLQFTPKVWCLTYIGWHLLKHKLFPSLVKTLSAAAP